MGYPLYTNSPPDMDGHFLQTHISHFPYIPKSMPFFENKYAFQCSIYHWQSPKASQHCKDMDLCHFSIALQADWVTLEAVFKGLKTYLYNKLPFFQNKPQKSHLLFLFSVSNTC